MQIFVPMMQSKGFSRQRATTLVLALATLGFPSQYAVAGGFQLVKSET